MITNERQYRITKAEAAKFEHTLHTFDDEALQAAGQPKRLVQAQREALQSQYQSLIDELADYEALKAGAVPVLKANSLAELPLLLIKARIASHLTQQALADKLGLKPQQIQRYESEHYVSASLERLIEVAAALNLDIKEEARILPSETPSVEMG